MWYWDHSREETTWWVDFPPRHWVLGSFRGGNDTAGGIPTTSLGTGIIPGKKRHGRWDSHYVFRHWGGSGKETTWRVGFPPRHCVLGSFRDTYLFPLPPHCLSPSPSLLLTPHSLILAPTSLKEGRGSRWDLSAVLRGHRRW
jgi:hypothetical protein